MSKGLCAAAEHLHRHYSTLITGDLHPINHSVSMGDAREYGWRELFKRFLPAKYSVKSGFIIDSQGNQSEQIDCIIFRNDIGIELYAARDQTVVPIEVVFAAFEIKPSIDKCTLEYANTKAFSISNLVLSNYASLDIPSFPSDEKVPVLADGQVIFGLLADKIHSTRKWASKSFRDILNSRNTKLQVFVTIDDGCVDTLDTAYPTSTYNCMLNSQSLFVMLIKIAEVMQELEVSRQLSTCCLSSYKAQLDKPKIETI